ncbi:ABC transporter ATP-binding protein [Candidatus Spongiihabitans sp.]|uniref:ABC transporter ATP-binding protein n=1 Tax=Candidatus Spongiihabitans sp. TaxID=3101308 RepID=UPI003C7A5D83
MKNTALSVTNLCKSYGLTEVLKDINFEIKQGDFLVLVGPSGCGKSTLLGCIAGLESLTSGSINISGRDMQNVDPGNRDIAMVFQSYALYPTMSVAKNITFSLAVRGIDKKTREEKLNQVAKKLQLENLLHRKPGQLSGGQRQRVAMGRALVREPSLFLFDEPLSNLDAKLRISMRTEIKKLHEDLGTTMVYVTHDQIEAMTLATKIVVMKDGETQQIGTPAEIYHKPHNVFVADFMGAPSINLLDAYVTPDDAWMTVELHNRAGEKIILRHPNRLKYIKKRCHVILGIRPEHISDVENTDSTQHGVGRCDIDVVEPAGADTYILTELCGKTVTARLNANKSIQAGSQAQLYFDLSNASFFDKKTGERLAW